MSNSTALFIGGIADGEIRPVSDCYDNCKVLDGAIWLGSWQHIEEMERKRA
jgi:hypothetical protein